MRYNSYNTSGSSSSNRSTHHSTTQLHYSTTHLIVGTQQVMNSIAASNYSTFNGSRCVQADKL